MSAEPVKKRSLVFSNGNKAIALLPSPEIKITDIVTALGLGAYKALIVISGGAGNMDQELIPVLTGLFRHGIAKAAAESNAILIDGGTKSGVMEMMGTGVAGAGYTSPLIGVAPLKKISLTEEGESGKTQLDPNHSHFVLVEGENWGSETATLFDLAKILAKKVPAMAILAGGGKVSKNEVLKAVQQNLYIIVIQQSGGLADEITAAWQKKPVLPDDPELLEIITKGHLHFYPIAGSVEGMENQVIGALKIKKL